MLRIRVGVALNCFRQPLKKALHTAAELGADAVEIDARTMLRPTDLSDTALRQIRKLLDDLNLTVCAISFPTRRGYHVADDMLTDTWPGLKKVVRRPRKAKTDVIRFYVDLSPARFAGGVVGFPRLPTGPWSDTRVAWDEDPGGSVMRGGNVLANWPAGAIPVRDPVQHLVFAGRLPTTAYGKGSLNASEIPLAPEQFAWARIMTKKGKRWV